MTEVVSLSKGGNLTIYFYVEYFDKVKKILYLDIARIDNLRFVFLTGYKL